MAQNQTVATEAQFVELFNSFLEIVDLTTGSGKAARARFRGFKTHDGVKANVEMALGLLRTDQIQRAVGKIQEATRAHLRIERLYAMNAVEKLFQPMMKDLGKLDSDINDAIGLRFREYVVIIDLLRGSPESVDINEVSNRYWALYNEVSGARIKQQARIRHREERTRALAAEESRTAIRELGEKERKRIEASRQVREEEKARRRARLEEVGNSLESQLAAVF